MTIQQLPSVKFGIIYQWLTTDHSAKQKADSFKALMDEVGIAAKAEGLDNFSRVYTDEQDTALTDFDKINQAALLREDTAERLNLIKPYRIIPMENPDYDSAS